MGKCIGLFFAVCYTTLGVKLFEDSALLPPGCIGEFIT